MNSPIKSGKKFEEVIQASELSSLSKDLTEVAVDSFMPEGILRNLPLVGGFFGIIKFGNSVYEWIFAKKIYRFLFELNEVSEKKRAETIKKINNSPKYRAHVGETLLELLERIESEVHPEIMGKLFAAVLEEKIDWSTFLRAMHIVKQTFYYDLLELKESYDGQYVCAPIYDILMINGIIEAPDLVKMYEEAVDTGRIDDVKNYENSGPRKASLTSLGKLIVEVGMK